jgi:hypothetical protein
VQDTAYSLRRRLTAATVRQSRASAPEQRQGGLRQRRRGHQSFNASACEAPVMCRDEQELFPCDPRRAGYNHPFPSGRHYPPDQFLQKTGQSMTLRSTSNHPLTLLLRFLYNTLQTHVLTPSLIPLTLRNARAIIFPNNVMGPPAPPPPSDEEQRAIRRKAASDLLSLVPNPVLRTYFATSEEEEMVEQVEEDILECFGDENMNKHLLYGILELVVVRLVPEMGEWGVSELMAERGVVLACGRGE